MSDLSTPTSPADAAEMACITKIAKENERRAGKRRIWGIGVSGAGVAATFIVVLLNWPISIADQADAAKHAFVLAEHRVLLAVFFLWAFCPPLWHAFEWMWYAPQRLSDDKAHEERYKQDIEDFKYSQMLSRNIWLSLLAVLALIYGINKSI